MALTYSVLEELGKPAPAFSLRGIAPDGEVKTYDLTSFREAKALVVMFMCNHCPYVIAVQERINQLAKEYASRGVALVGINPNDSVKYPADNFDAMKVRSREQGFAFPYLHDETQAVARAYGAVCTPDPYVYEQVGGEFKLRYHGRIDDNWKEPAQVQQRELATALDAILAGRVPNSDQKPAMGCSIKWK
ncbi:MAG: thioredoxin family protein [Bacteriovoracia bacterium]